MRSAKRAGSPNRKLSGMQGTSTSLELRRIVVGVTEITDEGD